MTINDFLIEYQTWVLVIALLAIPLVIMLLFIVLGRKNHDWPGRILMSIAVIYMYDNLLLGLSLWHLLDGTGGEYFILGAVGIVPLIIGIAVIFIYNKKAAWAGIGARIIACDAVYFLSAIYILVMGLGISSGFGLMLLLGLVPIVLGILAFFLLKRSYVVVTTDEDEVIFLKDDYDEKEVYDYVNHLE